MCTLSLADLERDQAIARDYGPEPIDAKTAMGAVRLFDATANYEQHLAEVMAANRPRLIRLALLIGQLSASDLMEPEETTEC